MRAGSSAAARPIVRIAMAIAAHSLAGTGIAHGQESRVPVSGLPEDMAAELRRALEPEPVPENLFEARRQAERAAEVVTRLMESEGYLSATVDPVASEDETINREVRVTPGPRFTLASLQIEFLENDSPDPETRAALDAVLSTLPPGSPARAEPVIQAGDNMIRILRQAGYPEVQAEPVDALADGGTKTLNLTFRLRPGPRIDFGDVAVSGLGRTRLDFIERLRPWRPGERYSPQRLDEFRDRIVATGLFETANVRLAEALPGESGAATERTVEVAVQERPRRTIAIGASASTSEGVGVEGEWETRNITGRGDSLTLAAQIATLQSRLEATTRRPNIGRFGRNIQLNGVIEKFETDAFDQIGGTASATLEAEMSRRVRASIGAEASYASIDDQRARTLGVDRREVYLVGGSLTAEYTGVQDVLDPTNGVRARIALEPGATWGDTKIGFTRLLGEASIYGDIATPELIGALRGRLGSILGANGAPPDRLFFAGGGGSVRGYEFQSLSARDSTGALVGGRSLFETSAELRWRRSDRLGFVAFVDAGAAGDGIEPPVDDLRAGAGLGVRYYAGFGPLRADIAVPLDKREGEADFQIYLSIGQAF